MLSFNWVAHRLTRNLTRAEAEDAAVNTLIVMALGWRRERRAAVGGMTLLWHSAWPDLLVGLSVFAINLDAAREVYGAARQERQTPQSARPTSDQPQ